MSYQLRSLMIQSMDAYEQFISGFDVVSDVDLNADAGGLSGNVPLFVLNLCSNGHEITFSPLLEEVVEVVQGVFTNIFVFTEQISGVGHMLFPLLGLPKFPLQTLRDNEPSVLQVWAISATRENTPT